jgi:uncharacterized protein GlcG (DUF336 family)
VPSLTLEDARQLIGAAEKKADELGVPYNIAVVDAGGNLIAHARMEKVVIFAGGAPIKIDDVVIGALGASGGTVEQDQKVADAALEAFTKGH